MKLFTAFLLTLVFIFDAGASNPLLPYGSPIHLKDGRIPEVCISITQTDTAWKPISPTYLFMGDVHEAIDGSKASLNVTKLVTKTTNDLGPMYQKLRSMDLIKPGAYSIFFVDEQGEFEVFKVDIKKKTGLIEIVTMDPVPIFEQGQIYMIPADANVQAVVEKLKQHSEQSVAVTLKQLKEF